MEKYFWWNNYWRNFFKYVQTPTIYNPDNWTLYEGNESDAPCANVDEWTQAFESIKYFNSKEVDAEDGENPFANEGTDGTDGTESDADDGSCFFR